jgi:hypothetical protein
MESVFVRRNHNYAGAFALRALDIQHAAHLFDALSHAGQTKTGMAVARAESLSVIY